MSDLLRFDGQVAIVTGAGGGLGRSHAEALAARGATVIVNDTGGARDGANPDAARAEEVAAAIRANGGTAESNTSSVATREGAEQLVGQAIQSHGRLDIVVNNAAVTGAGAFAAQAVWDRVDGTHLYGTVNVLRAAWPHFCARNYGRVVNTASSSFLGTPFSGDYAAAKGGSSG